MNETHPARVILNGWCPRGKEQFLFFNCAECNAIYDEHVQTLMETGVARCPYCKAHHHMSILEVEYAMKKMAELRKHT